MAPARSGISLLDLIILRSSKGAVRRKSGAYTVVCEHFEPIRNTAMST